MPDNKAVSPAPTHLKEGQKPAPVQSAPVMQMTVPVPSAPKK